MRARYAAFLVVAGLVALALIPSTGLTQYPGGGQPGGQPGGGGPGSGGPGGGGFSRGGSRGPTSGDPAQIWDIVSKGQSSISLTDPNVDSRMRDALNEWARRTNYSGTTITKDQFLTFSQSPEAENYRNRLMSRFGSRGQGGPGGAPMGAPGSPTPTTTGTGGAAPVVIVGQNQPTNVQFQPMQQPGGGGYNQGNYGGGYNGGYSGGPGGPGSGGWGGDRGSDRGGDRGGDRGREGSEFRRRDQNGDGVLSYDEMSNTLKGEKDKWDANHDGVVDQTEYNSYFKAFMEKQNDPNSGQGGFGQGGWGQQGGWGDQGGWGQQQGGWGGYGPQPTDEQTTRREEVEKKVTVYRAGKLPENLPSWFKDCDRDLDGQVALYEWKAKEMKVEEFTTMDRNGDGFVTFQEAILATTQPKTGGNAVASADTGRGRTGGFSFGGRGGSGTPGSTDQNGQGQGRPGGFGQGAQGGFGQGAQGGFGQGAQGGFGQGGFNRGGTPGGGTPGGGTPGGSTPGGSKSFADQMVDRTFGNKETMLLTEFRFGGDRLKEWAAKKGITEKITKEQYKEYMAEASSQRGGPGGSTPGGMGGPGGFNRGGSPGGATPGGTTPGGTTPGGTTPGGMTPGGNNGSGGSGRGRR